MPSSSSFLHPELIATVKIVKINNVKRYFFRQAMIISPQYSKDEYKFIKT